MTQAPKKLVKQTPAAAQAAQRTVSAPPRRNTGPVYNPATNVPDTSTYHNVDKLLIPELRGQIDIIRPGWEDMKEPTTFRILPAVNPEDTTKFMAYRCGHGPRDFNPWYFSAAVAARVGLSRSQVSFFLYDPRDPNYDPASNPYSILSNEFHDVFRNVDPRSKAGPEAMLGRRNVFTNQWFALRKTENYKTAAFSNLKELFYMKAAVYSNNKDLCVTDSGVPLGLGRKDKPTIMQLSGDSGRRLLLALNIKADPPPTDPKGYSAYFQHRDVTNLKTGKFITFYYPGLQMPLYDAEEPVETEADQQRAEAQAAKEDDGGGRRRGGGKKDHVESLRLMLHPTYTFMNEARRKVVCQPDLSRFVDTVMERHVWWEDIFWFPNHEEICELLATAFREAPDVIAYGWKDNPEFMTANVKGILAARVTGPGAEIPADDTAEEASSTRKKSRALPAVEEYYDDTEGQTEEVDENDENVDPDYVEEELTEEVEAPRALPTQLPRRRGAVEPVQEDEEPEETPAPPPKRAPARPAPVVATAPPKTLPRLPPRPSLPARPSLPVRQKPAPADDLEEDVDEALNATRGKPAKKAAPPRR